LVKVQESFLQFLFLLLRGKLPFVEFPKWQAEQNSIKDDLRESLYSFFKQSLIFIVCLLSSLGSFKDPMVDPIFDNVDPPPKHDENLTKDTVLMKFLFLFAILDHRFGEGPDHEREYLLERNHKCSIVIIYGDNR
jgi:hypothetical protein